MPQSRTTTASRRSRRPSRQPGSILDLFAGAGGWEEALKMLGLKALGIGTDPSACQTAQTAGHERLMADVAELDPKPGKAAVCACPLMDWSNQQMRDYRRTHRVPESPAAALLHRSGECNCGAMAKAEDERAMLKALYPEFFAEIEALEAEAQAAGVRWCPWGGYDIHGRRAGERIRRPAGILCESCEARQHAPGRSIASAQRRTRSRKREVRG